MHLPQGPSRRELLLLVGSLVACTRPLRTAPEGTSMLGRIIDAIAPGGNGIPSASAAGVEDYVRRSLASAEPARRAALDRGLAALRGIEGDPAAVLLSQDAASFEWLRRRTFEGLYGLSWDGGNRPALAWRWLEFP